ncbi:MAG: contractile injection system protein, VgrG/Pvc8 family, partial [Pseudonocardiaceae bacterium]
MAQASFSNVVHVTMGGGKLPDHIAADLVGAWVDLGSAVPGAFRLTFRDPHGLLLAELKLKFGTKVVLAPVAAGKGAATPLLTGEVTGMETDYDGAGTFTVIRGYDLGHRLLRQRRVAAYRSQTAADIARKLARSSGIPIGRVQATKTVYEFISQSNVTDWDFLSRLADENEMVMSLDSDGTFQFVERAPAAGAP